MTVQEERQLRHRCRESIYPCQFPDEEGTIGGMSITDALQRLRTTKAVSMAVTWL